MIKINPISSIFHPDEQIVVRTDDTLAELKQLPTTTPEVWNPFSQFRGISTTKMTTEQILQLTRLKI